MKHRVWQYKLLLLKRIKGQSSSTLSKQILIEQQANKWPGLSAEVKDICSLLNIPDLNECELTAGNIKKAILEHHDKSRVT